VTAAAASEV